MHSFCRHKKGCKGLFQQLHTDRLDALNETDKFLETHKIPKLTQEEIESLNRLKTSREIDSVTKTLTRKSSGAEGFAGESDQTL